MIKKNRLLQGSIILTCCIIGYFAWITFFNNKHTTKTDFIKIFISKVSNHPALNNTVQGIIDELGAAHYINGKNTEIIIESAQANGVIASQIATKFIQKQPHIIISVGTLATQAFLKDIRKKSIPLVFSSVTDPIGAHIVDTLSGTKNISGVSNFVPLEEQISLFKKLMPSIKKIGFLYNPAEANSVILLQKLQEITPNFNITIIPGIIINIGDITQATLALCKNIDALFISNDSTALSALPTIIATAKKNNIPVFVSDTDAVPLGALAALGPNQYDIGRQTGKMIVHILQNKNAKNIPIEFPNKSELFINTDTANFFNIHIPNDIRQYATFIKTEKS